MGKKLYVGNLSYNVTSADLQQLFAPHGTVQSAQVIEDRDTQRSKGFGFVEMGSDQEAQAAIAAQMEVADGRVARCADDEDYRVYTDHPRLFLQPRRLRMLKREVERQSSRWRQFETMMTGKARMAEPGFALALYSQASGKTAFWPHRGPLPQR